VILDVMMPGIDGLEVLRRLRQAHPTTELPVIMATAKDASQDVVQALALGANDYVTKPLDLPVLLARVSTQVSLRRSVEQIRGLERGLEHRNRELQAANTRMQEDLVAAARVQATLLPTTGPRAAGYRFAWAFEPSATLAGDILNVFGLDDDRVAAYVLDVSGHGVAAALLSVTVSRFLSPAPDPSSMLWRRLDDRPAAADDDATYARADFGVESPGNVAARLSRRFPFDQRTWQYFTMVYGLLDTRRHRFTYVSAGHPPVLRVRADGGADALEASGFPIGVGPDAAYDEYALDLTPGDRLYIHSDGLTEAANPRGELFGVERVLEVLRAARDRPLDASLRDLSAAVAAWTGAAGREDDQTALAIERLPTP
jgi:sigma-B regulation protein RsbU (phosphoserine phosphatase)